ncbi:hypothetical protein AF335_17330 [Streptomyces eurocidicus]|uniref:Uncharacterized protein n=1 Tax=Streptomyces eurocidicus TaxID=66423 RepID=A0A2N8NUE2_STREU|nr:hypothetical protein [Streptomyces eurocidicus]MBB5120223.1 hypothetical protein [Streptomyces eurocidicus]MBF6056093.1 hypothetical protein [Streptomyces eurocidicus]PNE32372.1 hypothetical protein AF335_17330 [Streptomyces eurocidicus]
MDTTFSTLAGNTREQTGATLTLIAVTGAVIALITWAAHEHRSKGRIQLWILLTASFLSWATDAGGRFLLQITISRSADQLVLFQSFGTEQPLWYLMVNIVTLSFPAYLAFLAFTDGWSPGKYWLTVTICTAVDMALEYLTIHVAGVYSYTGFQTLRLYGLPLVWPISYVTVSMCMGALVFFFGKQLNGIRWLLALPMLGSGYMGFITVTSWPALVALKTDLNTSGRFAAGVLTAVGLLAILYTISLFLKAAPDLPATTSDLPGEESSTLRKS